MTLEVPAGGAIHMCLNSGTLSGQTWPNAVENSMGDVTTSTGSVSAVTLDGVDGVSFDGSSVMESSDTPALVCAGNARSFEVWMAPVNPDSVFKAALSYGSSTPGEFVGIGWVSSLPMFFSGSGVMGSTTLTPNEWGLLTVVGEDGAQKVYWDGMEEATGTESLNTVCSNMEIGGKSDVGPHVRLEGTLASVRVYSGSLSAAQVLSNYQLGASFVWSSEPGVRPDAVALWDPTPVQLAADCLGASDDCLTDVTITTCNSAAYDDIPLLLAAAMLRRDTQVAAFLSTVGCEKLHHTVKNDVYTWAVANSATLILSVYEL